MTTAEKQAAIQKVITYAKTFDGHKESPVGSNNSTLIRRWGAPVGFPQGGVFWCAIYSCAMVRESGFDTPFNSASCDVILEKARKLGVLHSTPQIGDFFLSMKSEHDATHIGIVTAVGDDRFTTVEGNAANPGSPGSRNGDGAYYGRKRPNGGNYKFVRWVDAIQSTHEGVAAEHAVVPAPAYIVNIEYAYRDGDKVKSTAKQFPLIINHENRPAAPVVAMVAAIKTMNMEAAREIVGWNAETKKVTVDGKDLPLSFVIGSVGHAFVRDIAEALGRALIVNKNIITVKKLTE